MWRVLVVVGLRCVTDAVVAIPPEPCPGDSFALDGRCACASDRCVVPPCLSELKIVRNGTGQPGECCAAYDCVGCKNETAIGGKCPCAEGAVIDDKGVCTCVNAFKHIVDGVCVCNPLYCPLPHFCDKKSVLVAIDDGCCKKYICQPCPEDSESTNYDGDELEDHCVCLPCRTECGPDKKVVIKRNGTNLPGSCCDIYECQPMENLDKDCTVDDIIYSNGDKWSTSDNQNCTCQNGISLCSEIHEERSQLCISDGKVYHLNETWTKDDGCTNCTCLNGEAKCISHFCDVKESQVQTNEKIPCYKESKLYAHLEEWKEEEDCSHCWCQNGKISCVPVSCNTKETNTKKSECQPLFECNKTCPHGFKVNRKGCEICKCSAARIGPDLLARYNITMNDLINILDDWRNGKSTVAPILENDKFELKEVNATSTTEPAVAPADKPENALVFVIIALAAVVVVIIAATLFCIYRNKRKHSMDLSHCQYQTVSTLNNNTIKKTDQLL